MLMDTLKREVEALGAEVTRLRFMVYHIRDAVQAAPRAATCARCEKSHRTSRDAVGCPHGENSKRRCNVCRSHALSSEVMTPEVIQLLERLLASSKGVAEASSARQEGGDANAMCESARQSKELRSRDKKRKHHHCHQGLSLSSLPKSPHGTGNCSKHSCCHANIHQRSSQERVDSTKDDCAGSLSVLKQSGVLQTRKLQQSEGAEKPHLQQARKEEEPVCVKAHRETLKNFSSSSLRANEYSEKDTPANRVTFDSRRSTSVLPEGDMPAPICSFRASTIDKEGRKPEAEQGPRAVDVRTHQSGTNTEGSLSSDGNRRFSVAHDTLLPETTFTPPRKLGVKNTTDAVVSEVADPDDAQPLFVPLNTVRSNRTQRRTLLERFREASDLSTV